MPLPQLHIYRHDSGFHALITLAGELDLVSAPPLRDVLARCLDDGIRKVDIDLGAMTFCDCSGLRVFLESSQHLTAVGGGLRLLHVPRIVHCLLDITGTGFLLS
jgi:anti-sigma B factor antagonist